MIRFVTSAALLIGFASVSSAAAPASAVLFATTSSATGLGVNVPVIGRLIGSGGILFKTALDVSNNTGTAAQIDFYLAGLTGSTPVSVTGSISSTGTLVLKGAGGTVRGHSNYHSDDFVDALVKAGMVPASAESAAGFLGSVRFVFNGFSKSGQGSAAANFYRDLVAPGATGTIGVSATGHEISANEPTKLVGTFRNRLGQSGPQVYPNLFINNIGLTPIGTAAATPVDVQISAYSNATGNPVGTTQTLTGIAPGQTVAFGKVLTALSVPASEDTVIVFVTVVSGNAAIAALAVQVDDGTHDSASVELHRADF